MNRSKFSLLWNSLLTVQKIIMIITSLFLPIIVFASVIMRYIFKTDLYGIEEIVTLVAFWLYFIGSSYGSYDKSQISADILSGFMKNEKHKFILGIITQFVSLIILIVVDVWATQFIGWSLKMNPKTAIYRFPIVIPQLSVLIGLFLMTFYNFVYLVQDVIEVRTKKDFNSEA